MDSNNSPTIGQWLILFLISKTVNSLTLSLIAKHPNKMENIYIQHYISVIYDAEGLSEHDNTIMLLDFG